MAYTKDQLNVIKRITRIGVALTSKNKLLDYAV